MIHARKEAVVQDYFGTPVADPYRWMEDIALPETRNWQEGQNRATRQYLDAIPVRAAIELRLRQLWSFERCSLPVCPVPVRRGGLIFFLKQDGLQSQPVLCVQQGVDGRPRTLVDPNALSTDGTVALTAFSPSRDGSEVAYALSCHGSDWQEIHIRNVGSGEDYPETLRRVKFTSIAWRPDGTFYYSRFPDAGEVPPSDESCYCRVYRHRPRTSQSSDELVYQRSDDKDLSASPEVTEDGRFLIIYTSRGTDPRDGIDYRDEEGGGGFVRLTPEGRSHFEIVGNDGPRFYLITDDSAPRGRIIAIDLNQPAREHWIEVVPEAGYTLENAVMVSDRFVITYLQDACGCIGVHHINGNHDCQVPVPPATTVLGTGGKRCDNDVWIAMASFLQPPAIWRFSLADEQLIPWHVPEYPVSPSQFRTEQVYFTSKDGTPVPMFLTYREGMKRNGDNPVLLYGYGGFNASMTPAFSPSVIQWLEQGGVFAHVNLRGGGEFGEEWHRAGMLERKQNVFDDFQAAAEWLVSEGVTRPGRLAITGRSNGGLLVAACMLQRPELFGAVICNVPVTDMLRYHRFTVGRYWIPEYGNAEDSPDQFRVLHAYSPLHNVKPGVRYPPIIIGTGEADDRVWPAHAFKFAATLQEAAGGHCTVLLRVESKAGHGLGKPIGKLIDEEADFYAFIFRHLGME